jgi:hypothetical protein
MNSALLQAISVLAGVRRLSLVTQDGAESPVQDGANDEIEQQADVDAIRAVPKLPWQVGHERKIHEVAEQNGKQRPPEVRNPHRIYWTPQTGVWLHPC